MLDSTGGGAAKVQGVHMRMLGTYLLAADPVAVRDFAFDLQEVQREFDNYATTFRNDSKHLREAYSESSYTAESVGGAFNECATHIEDKGTHLAKAVSALFVVAERFNTAHQVHAQLHESLPSSLVKPDPTAPEYSTSGPGMDSMTVQYRSQALSQANQQYAADAATVAAAEKKALEQIHQLDDAMNTASPQVKKITDEPYKSPSGVSDPGSSSATGAAAIAGYSPAAGSRSKVKAAQARYDAHIAGSLYADGRGEDIRAEAKAEIAAAHAENIPEWDDQAGMFVQADGSPSPVEHYAGLETPDGLSPLSGGKVAATLGVVLGGAGLAVGATVAAKAAAANGVFGSKLAMAAGARATASPAKLGSIVSKADAARAAGAGGRGSAARAGAPGTSKAQGKAGSAGQRGAGAAGGRGKGKDKSKPGTNTEYIADYTDDWIDPDDRRDQR